MIRRTAVLLALALWPVPAFAGPAPRRGAPLLVLQSPDRGEWSVEAGDLRFAYFERSIRQTGRGPARVLDERHECRCLRLEDWSKKKFKKLREIEIEYPAGRRSAHVRFIESDGRVREITALDLFGAATAPPPRFVATVGGDRREYPLVLEGDSAAAWPDERPVRIVFTRKAPPRRR